MGNRAMLSDAELCDLLGITPRTLQRHLRHGPPRGRRGASAGDLRTIQHVLVGSQRRWKRSSVDAFINGE